MLKPHINHKISTPTILFHTIEIIVQSGKTDISNFAASLCNRYVSPQLIVNNIWRKKGSYISMRSMENVQSFFFITFT